MWDWQVRKNCTPCQGCQVCDVNSGICCKFENIDAHSADHPLINQVNFLSPTSTISYFNFQCRSLTRIVMSIIKAIQLLLAYRSELSVLRKKPFLWTLYGMQEKRLLWCNFMQPYNCEKKNRETIYKFYSNSNF